MYSYFNRISVSYEETKCTNCNNRWKAGTKQNEKKKKRRKTNELITVLQVDFNEEVNSLRKLFYKIVKHAIDESK